MKRKHKQYSRPKNPFNKARIEEEAEITKEFGLKNKKEIWRADAKISSFREKAKKLIGANAEEQEVLFNQLKKIGIEVNSIADVLGLEKKDYLNRRLQTVVHRKKLAPTAKTARQLITHKKVLVNGRAIDSPSYIVPVKLEGVINVKSKRVKSNKLSEDKVSAGQGEK
jgi:small subunit ribosomal protein S4